MNRNEAAERLRDRTLPEDAPPEHEERRYTAWANGWDTAHDKIGQLLDEALAAERRATVLDVMLEFGQWLANTPSRIYDLQDTLDSGDGDDYRAFAERFLATILDEEAQR